jgi:hypothetical protein
MWIIQEVVFNIDMRLMYDDEEISWVRFIAALRLYQEIRELANRSGTLDRKIQEITVVSSMWRQYTMFGRSFRDQPETLLMIAH